MEDIRWHKCKLCADKRLRESCLLFERIRQQRDDLVFAAFDIGPDKFISLAPPHYWRAPPPTNLSRARFFATCRGTFGRSHWWNGQVRAELQRELGLPQKDARVAADLRALGVVVELWNSSKAHPGRLPSADVARYLELMDTFYALLPRGDGLWTYRFSDAVGACAIPVVLADKLHLPYAPVVNWTGAAIVLPQSIAGDREALLRGLPRDVEVITQMRQRVCEINRRHFATERLRFDSLLRSAVAIAAEPVRRSGSSEPAALPARRGRGLDGDGPGPGPRRRLTAEAPQPGFEGSGDVRLMMRRWRALHGTPRARSRPLPTSVLSMSSL